MTNYQMSTILAIDWEFGLHCPESGPIDSHAEVAMEFQLNELVVCIEYDLAGVVLAVAMVMVMTMRSTRVMDIDSERVKFDLHAFDKGVYKSDNCILVVGSVPVDKYRVKTQLASI